MTKRASGIGEQCSGSLAIRCSRAGRGRLKARRDKSHKVWRGRGGWFFRGFRKVILPPQGAASREWLFSGATAQGQGHHGAG